MGVSMAAAKTWVERWERQQQHYAVDREERFTVITDVVEHMTADRLRPLLLDLGCGPGSLSARLADRLPDAEIIAVDMDPLLLELGRTHHADAARYVEATIGADGWTDVVGVDRPVDAAVSTTALHYLAEPSLLDTYRSLAGLLRPGGVLVNGDHFPPADGACASVTAHLGRRLAERTNAHSSEDWQSWWAAAALDPELADLFDERRQRLSSGGGNASGHFSAAHHTELLLRSGFAHASQVWQYGDSGVLVAVKG
ncbi:class I SAM-dependent methyltransferase [Streptomyces bauhiniae]|uniref:class I SAM-dependent methyltransferase n=1 Tax=Streptomyces bauhiniae TaxID=2340725 RepID=UPI0033253E4D